MDNQQQEQLNIMHLQIIQHNEQRRRKRWLTIFATVSVIYLILRMDEFTDVKTIDEPATNTTQKAVVHNYTDLIENAKDKEQAALIYLRVIANYRFDGTWSGGEKMSMVFQYLNKTEHVKLIVELNKGEHFEDDHVRFVYYLEGMNATMEDKILKANCAMINGSAEEYNVYGASTRHKGHMSLHIEISGINENPKIHIESKVLDNVDNWQFDYSADASADNESARFEQLAYSTIVSILAFVQIVSCLKLYRDIMTDERSAGQLSMVMITIITTVDGYLSLVHFYFALLNDVITISYSKYFITPSFLYFILFSLLELKLLTLVWRERYGHIQDHMILRKELYKFYFKFYTFMIITIILLYKYVFYNSMLIILTFFIVPQIIHSAMRGQQINFDRSFIFGFLAPRLFVPLYFRGCPANILEMRTSYGTCLIMIAIMAIQIYFYYIQCTYGPRYFLPAFMKPKQHQYFIDPQIEGDCAVCMGSVQQQATQQDDLSQNRIIRKIIDREQNKIMMTPCQHYFHSECLTRWMNVKMTCPTCRSDLPPLL